jgi:hypothetical protein
MRRQKADRDGWETADAGQSWDQADFETIREPLADLPISALMKATGCRGGVHGAANGQGGLLSPALGRSRRTGRRLVPVTGGR